MIWPSESLLLAGTKLKVRRTRLIITVIITSLLFSVLVFLASAVQGTIHSLKSFSEEGYGNKYFVQASPLTYQMNMNLDAETTKVFTPVQKDLIAQKKAAAKKLGIEYNDKVDQTLPMTPSNAGPNGSSAYPNYMSPLIQEYLRKKTESIPGTTYDEFVSLVRSAGAVNTLIATSAANAGK